MTPEQFTKRLAQMAVEVREFIEDTSPNGAHVENVISKQWGIEARKNLKKIIVINNGTFREFDRK
jgi:hypothetical protein